MIALWARMTQWFPQWQSLYGGVDDPAIYAWTGALARYTEDELGGAIRSCENWDGKFPPSFPEFKSMVMAARSATTPNHTDKRIAMEKQHGKPVAMIEHLARKATSEVAQRELAKMRRILAGEEVETREEAFRNLGLHARWQS